MEEELILRENNLFRKGKILSLPDGSQLLVRNLLTMKPTVQDLYYTVKKEDRLDRIAWKFYNKYVTDASKFWWVIADVNRIYNPLDLSLWVGKEIRIPNILNVKLVI